MAEKDEKLKSVATELERTQKALRMLNNRTSRLDHLINLGKSFGDHSGIGFKGDSSASNIVFIKSSLLIDLIDPSKKDKFVINSVATKGKHVVQQTVSID